MTTISHCQSWLPTFSLPSNLQLKDWNRTHQQRRNALRYLLHNENVESIILATTFYYIIPYGALAYLGYYYIDINIKVKRIIAAVSFVIFTLVGIYYWIDFGSIQLISIAKYPPRIYYLCYGVTCSFFFLLFLEKHPTKLPPNSLIRFISMHSMWIYLWHILWLTIYEKLQLPSFGLLKYIFVYIGAIITVIGLNKLLDIVEKRCSFPILKYLRG